jgi:hypothetical protein
LNLAHGQFRILVWESKMTGKDAEGIRLHILRGNSPAS